MSEVLIVADLVDSHVSKPTLELLTLARRLGEPAAVVFGETDETVAKTLGEYGAARVLFDVGKRLLHKSKDCKLHLRRQAP